MSNSHTLFVNAHFHTFDPSNPTATALLTRGEVIEAVGEEEALRAATSGFTTVDLGGRTVLPGLVDAHVHALTYAESLAELDLSRTTSLPEAVNAIRGFAARLPAGQWVTGGRWDYTKWGLGHQPDRTLLDEALPDRPVALWSIDFHTLWCNGAALRHAGIDRATPDPRGGHIVRDADGDLTGILREDAATLVERTIPHPPEERLAELMRAAVQQWLSEGLTGIHDIDGTYSRLAWQKLRGDGELGLRVVKFLRLDEYDWAKEVGWTTGGGSAWYRHGGLKLFSDGALGSRSSYMSSPYPAEEGRGGAGGASGAGGALNYGMQIATEDVLIAQMRDAYAHGIVPIVHAIGDRANHHVLNAFAATAEDRQAAQARLGIPLRARIEHAQFLQPADVARFAQLGVVASMQPRHCISDLHLLRTLHPDPGLAAYAWPTLLGAGAHVAFGSDAPVEPTNPFGAIYAAMTRADISGDPATTFQPELRMSAYDAIRCHTFGPAYAAGVEASAGVLKPGMNADFIAVNYDPLGVAEFGDEDALFAHATAVRDTVVTTTVVGGKVRMQR